MRHKDASRQAVLYGIFAVLLIALLTFAFVWPLPGRWFMLVLVPVALFLSYSALRLATLRVRVDERGLWEPSPFRLTYVTPWTDIARVRRCSSGTSGTLRQRFIGVEIVHQDGGTHEVLALKTQAGAAYAEKMVEDWIDQIRDAKRAARA